MHLLHLSVPPLPPSARAARTAVQAFAGVHHLSSTETEDLAFAVGEAIANAITHAGVSDVIEVDLRIDSKSVVATIRDRGHGCPNRPTGRVSLPDVLAENGRGFAIMERCTDSLEVDSAPGGGTMVRLVRRRRPQEVGSR